MMANVLLYLLIGVWCLIIVILALGFREVYLCHQRPRVTKFKKTIRESPELYGRITDIDRLNGLITPNLPSFADRQSARAFTPVLGVLPTAADPVLMINGGGAVDESPARAAAIQSANVIDLATHRQLHQSQTVASAIVGNNATLEKIEAKRA